MTVMERSPMPRRPSLMKRSSSESLLSGLVDPAPERRYSEVLWDKILSNVEFTSAATPPAEESPPVNTHFSWQQPGNCSDPEPEPSPFSSEMPSKGSFGAVPSLGLKKVSSLPSFSFADVDDSQMSERLTERLSEQMSITPRLNEKRAQLMQIQRSLEGQALSPRQWQRLNDLNERIQRMAKSELTTARSGFSPQFDLNTGRTTEEQERLSAPPAAAAKQEHEQSTPFQVFLGSEMMANLLCCSIGIAAWIAQPRGRRRGERAAAGPTQCDRPEQNEQKSHFVWVKRETATVNKDTAPNRFTWVSPEPTETSEGARRAFSTTTTTATLSGNQPTSPSQSPRTRSRLPAPKISGIECSGIVASRLQSLEKKVRTTPREAVAAAGASSTRIGPLMRALGDFEVELRLTREFRGMSS
jgi:hypothetical protein